MGDSEFTPIVSRNPLYNPERGISYPSPFFDVASTYVPRSVKALYRFCDYYYRTNPLINAICTKLSEYPITDIVIESSNERVQRKWEHLIFEQLMYKSFEIGTGLDYHVFGISFTTMTYPFHKLLICQGCGTSVDAADHKKSWRYAVDRFLLTCPKCGHKGKALVKDWYVPAVNGIRVVRRHPQDIDVRYHEGSGRSNYIYTPPSDLRADIVAGKQDVVLDTPQEVIEAVRLGRSIRLNPENVYVMKRSTCSTTEQGLGIPVIMPVLKDTFYLQILKKAQEALSIGYIVPLRIFFPQAGGPMQDPISTIDLKDWKDSLERELKQFRVDPLYQPIVPFPVGHQLIGGEGRALLLSQEIRLWSEQIVAGMGFPPSLVFGDVAWSGASIALRMLENSFLRYMEHRKGQFEFVTSRIARYMRWERPDFHLKPFKMADDIQRQQLDMQLNQMGKISDETLVSATDHDPKREQELLKEERDRNMNQMIEQNRATARLQGETMLVQAEYQARAMAIQQQVQQALAASGQVRVPGTIGGPQGVEAPSLPVPSPRNVYTGALQGLDALVVPRKLAEQISTLPPAQRQAALMQLQGSQPETYHQVMKYMAPAAGGKPLPEQKPPRRGPSSATV